MNDLPKLIREAAEPLTGSPRDYDPLLDLVGDAWHARVLSRTGANHQASHSGERFQRRGG